MRLKASVVMSASRPWCSTWQFWQRLVPGSKPVQPVRLRLLLGHFHVAFLAAVLADAVQRHMAVRAAPLELGVRHIAADRVFVHLVSGQRAGE